GVVVARGGDDPPDPRRGTDDDDEGRDEQHRATDPDPDDRRGQATTQGETADEEQRQDEEGDHRPPGPAAGGDQPQTWHERAGRGEDVEASDAPAVLTRAGPPLTHGTPGHTGVALGCHWSATSSSRGRQVPGTDGVPAGRWWHTWM